MICESPLPLFSPIPHTQELMWCQNWVQDLPIESRFLFDFISGVQTVFIKCSQVDHPVVFDGLEVTTFRTSAFVS